MSDYADLQTAIVAAFLYHKGQKRLDGSDYIYHPLSVMMQLQHESYECQIVAILHDTLEDTTISKQMIKEIFGIDILSKIIMLTKQESTDYEQYISDIKYYDDPCVTKVKIADLSHNLCTIDYIKDSPKRIKLKKRYENALRELS